MENSIDREKVIKGLKCCAAMSGDECRECPYGHECRDTDLPYGMPHLADDALALLKQQDNDIHHMGLIIDEYEKELKKLKPADVPNIEFVRRDGTVFVYDK